MFYKQFRREKITKAGIDWVENNNSLFLISSTVVYVEFSEETSYDLDTLIVSAESALIEEKRMRNTSTYQSL